MSPEQHDMLVRIDERVAVLHNGQQDQEARIRKLERFRNWAGGILSLALAALGFKNFPLQP